MSTSPSPVETRVPLGRLSVRIDDVTPAEWDRLLEKFADAGVYQSWAYGATHWGQNQLSHLIVEKDGTALALCQVRTVLMPLVRKGIAYVRWGPLCRLHSEPFSPEALRLVTEALLAEYVHKRGLFLRILPPAFTGDAFAPAWESVWSNLGLRNNKARQAEHTMRVDLGLSLEDLRKNLHQRWRNYLKSAEKAGFTVRDGTAIEFYDAFFSAYREMMARKRFATTVDVDEFRQIQLALPESQRMRIFLAEKDGNLFNALVVSTGGDTGIYLLAGTSNAGLNGKGAHLLQWRAIEWLKSAGYRWYDLGGINPQGNPGVYQFKSGLGGQEAFQLGVFESCADWLSGLSVRAGESLQAARNGLSARMQRSRST